MSSKSNQDANGSQTKLRDASEQSIADSPKRQDTEIERGVSIVGRDHSNDGRAVVGGDSDSSVIGKALLGSSASSPVGALSGETAQFGRDDLKRGEAGSSGNTEATATGSALSHLVGLGDEEPGLRNGEKISSSDNQRFLGEATGVGQGVDHLWLLGDFDYYRASTDHREVDELLPNLDFGRPAYGPLIKGPLAFSLSEDDTFNGEIFSGAEAVLPATDIAAQIDPSFGTITINPDGTFEYIPLPNFSGKAEFTYSFTDPRTGEPISGTAALTVAAVADPAIVSGAATTPEDTLVAAPVNVQLGDTDGSETICSVDITNVPAGATLGFSGAIAATVTNLAGGGIQLTGSTADIQAALLLLTFDPALHFSGQVTLNVAVKTIESNSDPDVPGYRDTETVNHSHVITVVPVADTPTVTGGNFTTDEDQRVALTGLNGALVDTDTSETLSIEIRGVDANAKLENAAGVEFPFVTATDGSKTYTINPADIGGVFYNPPPNEHGTFNMTIVPTATEGANNDQASNSAPIRVVINPVNDLPDVSGSSSTDEDTAVNFGGNITIDPIVDPDGSEHLTRVTITGVPSGVTPTGTNVGGASIAFDSGTGTITVSGGTEQNIRDTLATLTLTPPAHTDDEINLQVSVETTDGGVVATSTPVPHVITVAAIADAPTLSASASGTEDNPIPLVITTGLVDTDTSETFDYAEVTMPTGINLNLPATLPNGIQVSKVGDVYTFTPGTATTAQFASFLSSGISIDPPLDSDVDFPVTIKVGTIESNPSGGQVTTLRADSSTTITVEVTPVVDTPTINSSSIINEDAIVDPSLAPTGANIQAHTVGTTINSNIALGETAAGDTSEAITSIQLTGIPAGAQISYTPVGGGAAVNLTVPAGGTSLTFNGGSEAAIRTALATLTIIPPAHSDANISLGVAVTVLDTDPDNAASNATQTFNGTHDITVRAVADAPTLTSTAVGFEDQSIPVTINVGHPDNADGSERIKDVVISGVPDGFTLTTSSGLGTLAPTAGVPGSYTVTGPNDAAIDDILTNLSLTIAGAPNARTHLDTDFNLSVQVTSEENNPSEAGAGEIARLENIGNFTVPVTVHAVADAVTHSGSSVIVEDVSRTIGTEIQYAKIDTDGTEAVTTVTVSGFPTGATVSYTDVGGTPVTFTDGRTITLTGGTEAQIRAALDSLNVQSPLHSDVDFTLTIAATTTDNTTSPNVADHTETTTWSHAVTVQAVADTPGIATTNITGNEDTPIVLSINADRSADGQTDASEVLSVRVTLPQDGGSPIGTVIATGTVTNGVTVTHQGGGVYLIEGPGTGTPAQEEALIDAFLTGGGLALQPRAQFSGTFTGVNGIRVDAISTETATGVGSQVAPNSFGGSDNTSQTETVTLMIDVTINPVVDTVTFANSSTIVQENNNLSSPTDPDLVVPLGTRLGTTLADLDGSQSLSMTLDNIPATAGVAFGATSLTAGGAATISGVSVSLNGAGTEISISGSDAADVLTVLQTLNVTLQDDDDSNFQVAINGTTVDTVGGPAAPFTATHDVVVQAVADTPDVDVGAATKPTVQEDSGFITYPVTVDLNDDDGSESYQSVVVDFSTPGSGALPTVQFGVTTGVTVTSTGTGQLTLTGGSVAQMEAALASMQVQPGANNGEDITVTVTATAVESSPSEANNNGPGVAGDEISVPTASNQATFVIPIDPVPEVPTINAPAAVSGTEDVLFALSGLSVTTATSDPDGSESSFVEIDTSSFPSGTVFYSGATQHTNVIGGFLRISEADFATLQMQAPLHYSGTINLSVRAVVVDSSSSNSSTSTSATTTIAVDVDPVADVITTPSRSTGVEDNGPVGFGADIASTTSGLRVTDTVVGAVGEGGDETLSQVSLLVPADTTTRTYTMSGTFVPGSNGTIAGSGSAEIQLATDGSGNRTYTITSTIVTGAADVGLLTDAQRDQAEADIRATLATFQVEMGPTHSDLDGTITVTATALDVKEGDASTLDTTYNHRIRIQAVADTPTITASAVSSSASEDAGAIALNINPGRSPDDDNSETLSVRITVPSDSLGTVGTITGTPPAGVTVTDQGGGVYLVEATGADAAAREAALDGFLNGGGLSFNARGDFSGQLDLTIESISTEAANGGQLAPGSFGGADATSKTETVATTVSLTVTPVVDTPIVKGNATGQEDQSIPVPLNITLGDTDGSETATVTITGTVPTGVRVFGAGGTEIFPGTGYVLSQADIDALTILPPQHYSSAHSAPIVLNIETTVTDTAGATSVSQTFNDTLNVEVAGVADKPNNPAVSVSADEDQPIALGAGIVTAAGGNLNSTLVDQDGSETLSFVLEGVPAGLVPTSSVAGGVQFIGGGKWAVSAAAVPSLELPAVPNFSGTNPYSTIVVRSVSQEVDGDEATSDPWPVTIDVNPVIDNATVDGFSSWDAAVTVTEDNDISLANAAAHVLIDNDGSEQVISYTFDLSNLIADAQIGDQLDTLTGVPGSGFSEFVASYLNGNVDSIDVGAQTVTVLAADIAGFGFKTAPFLDSNVDFNIPLTALVRDTAVLSSGTVTTDKIESTTFNVDLVGDADIPTTFANDATGNAFSDIKLDIGGENTDTDSDLGRAESEDQLYYILEVLNPADAPTFYLFDGAGNLTGSNLGGGSFLLTPAQINDVYVRTVPGPGGEIRFGLTTHTVENDGDRAQSSAAAEMTVTVLPDSGTVPPDSPLAPIITVNPIGDNEDGAVTLNANVVADPLDTTNPSVTVVIGNLPAGTQVQGAYLDPSSNEWIASAADVNSGAVVLTPPANFSGDLDFTVRAVATNGSLQTTATADQPHSVPIDPVADGVNISASPAAANEDVAFDLNISVAAIDTTDQSASPTADTPEVVDNIVFVRASSGTLSAGTLVVGGANDGFYQMTLAELATLQLTSDSNLHGSVTIDVRASSTETDDDADGDHTLVSSHSFTVDITALADAPTTAATGPFAGNEDTAISLAGLNADLVDTDGSEVLSIKISGVPDGSLFSAGTNNGDGTWTIPKSALDANTLTITPPQHYSGTMSLTLEAYALELSNGNTNTTATPFTVSVAPVADDVLVLAQNVTANGSGSADLSLNVRMEDDRGTEVGENPAEQIAITFSSVPTGVSLEAGSGGTVQDLGGNQWRFTGTETQANDLQMSPSETSTAGTYVVSLSAVTIDGADTLATAVTDTFQLTIPTVLAGDGSANTLSGGSGTQLIYGLDGGDVLSGGADNDYLLGGAGMDMLTGGSGADTFAWEAADLDGSVDQVMDFSLGDGDILDVSALLVGFDPATSVLSDYLRTTGSGSVTLQVDVDGAAGGSSFQDVTVFNNAGQSLDDLRTNGNLIV